MSPWGYYNSCRCICRCYSVCKSKIHSKEADLAILLKGNHIFQLPSGIFHPLTASPLKSTVRSMSSNNINTKSRLSLIIRVNVVLNRTVVVDSD